MCSQLLLNLVHLKSTREMLQIKQFNNFSLTHQGKLPQLYYALAACLHNPERMVYISILQFIVFSQ